MQQGLGQLTALQSGVLALPRSICWRGAALQARLEGAPCLGCVRQAHDAKHQVGQQPVPHHLHAGAHTALGVGGSPHGSRTARFWHPHAGSRAEPARHSTAGALNTHQAPHLAHRLCKLLFSIEQLHAAGRAALPAAAAGPLGARAQPMWGWPAAAPAGSRRCVASGGLPILRRLQEA